MYSVVLLAAMTTATETPDCWFRGGGCHGCYGGSCYGGYYGSCYGSCYGGCYGSSCWGSSCYGCYGGCYGCWGGWGHSYGCHGCYGCWGCYGGCYGSVQMVVPVRPDLPPPKDKDKEEAAVPAKAKLIVELPADAKLYIDDQPMKTTAAVRQFNTPELQPGLTYYYMVRVEVAKEGAPPQTVTRRVLVRAGEEVTADFKDMTAPVATVKK
jgi:uncharacterized protein (TIGR03000 family)